MDPHRASNSSVFPLNSTLGPGHNIEHDNPTPRTSQNFDATWQWSGSGVTNNIWDPSQAQLPFVDNTSGVTPGPFHPSSSSSSRRPDLHGALPALESQLPTSYPDPAQWPQNRNPSFHSCQLGFQYTTCSTSAQRSSPEAAGQFEVPEPPPKTSDNAKAFPNVLSEIYCPPPDATLPQFTSSAVLTAPSMQLGLPPPPRHIQEIFVAPDESPSPGDHAGTQAPNEGAQGESQKHVSKRQKKKERDRERKHNERFNTSQDHEKICELLEVPLNPKKTLAQRILHAVEALVDQRKDYFALRRQVEEVEAGLKFSIGELARLYDQHRYTDTSPCPSMSNTALGGSDTGNEGHNDDDCCQE